MSAVGQGGVSVGFTPDQLRKLNRPVNGRYVHTREVDGQRLKYLEGWYVIKRANEIFGFAGWDRTTLYLDRVHEKARQDHIVCGYTARVRITVRTPAALVTRDGTGWGWGASGTAGQAHERAIKAAETDATKRALQTFGPQFGLALCDRNHPNRVSGVSLFAPDGSLLSDGLSPEAFSTGLRQLIEQTSSVSEIEDLARFNASSVADLRKINPDLKNVEGTHFSELLLRLIEFGKKRLLKTNLSPIQDETIVGANQKPPATAEATSGLSHIGEGPKIDKSELAYGNEKRIRDKEHLRRVAELPCLICGRQPSHAHHLKFAQKRGLSQKVSDEYVVPLCALHHGDLHRASVEQQWWQRQSINALAVAEELWTKWRATRLADSSCRVPDSLHSANGELASSNG